MSEYTQARSRCAWGAGGRGRGHGGRGRGRSGPRGPADQNQSLGDGVPILRFGPDNNFSKFRERLARAAMETYGDLGRLIEDDQYYEPVAPNLANYNLEDDDHGVHLSDYKEARRLYLKEVVEMKRNWPNLYTMMLGKLSLESLEEIKRCADYVVFHKAKDPLKLWMAIKGTHLVGAVSLVDAVVSKNARDAYSQCRQGAYESIISFKERYVHRSL